VAVNLAVGLASAESAKCVLEVPIKRTEHWSYRIVNGQRCWFPCYSACNFDPLSWGIGVQN
jgi:hypothetical protein